MLVECVPNFSEGRRLDVVNAIAEAIHSAGVHLLHQTSDADHNRSVITFAGEPDAVLEAAFRGIAAAAQHIDMDQHSGAHPRIGAADVVPFVPLAGATLADCIDLARRLGQRVGDELNIPVFLYEAAATAPERKSLADVRRGEYEGLKAQASLQADYGAAQVGKAGATAIGARLPLIAYNVYLNTDDITIARKIALTIRQSSGGLMHVKALGLLVQGQAQVSMNLTDHQRTGIPQVMEMIRSEARRYGVAVVRSELIGLMPQAALLDVARWYLQLDDFSADDVLEWRIKTAQDSP